MIVMYGSKEGKVHVAVHCNFFERLKYLFTNKIKFVLDGKHFTTDDN